MGLIQELDTGTPIRVAAETVTLTIDGAADHACRAAPR